MNTPAPAPKSANHGFLSLALDFGPLLAFFLGFKFGSVMQGTAAFMVAIVIAVVVSMWKVGRVSPMLWLSAILVIFFGGLTLYFHNERFIQIKPTIIYTFFSLMLFAGLARGKPLLKYLLQAAYDGLSDRGWLILSRNWAFFFAAMALLNEGLRAWFTFDTWLTLKVWGVTALSFIFAMSNLPMLMRHGLSLGDETPAEEAAESTPPQG